MLWFRLQLALFADKVNSALTVGLSQTARRTYKYMDRERDGRTDKTSYAVASPRLGEKKKHNTFLHKLRRFVVVRSWWKAMKIYEKHENAYLWYYSLCQWGNVEGGCTPMPQSPSPRRYCKPMLLVVSFSAPVDRVILVRTDLGLTYATYRSISDWLTDLLAWSCTSTHRIENRDEARLNQ